MGFYEGIRDNVAAPLVKKFGVAIILLRYTTPRTFDPLTQEYSDAGVQKPYPGYGVLTEFTLEEKTNTNIQAGDKKLLATGIIRPQVSDEITLNTITYNVIAVEIVSPGGVDVVYKLQVRE